MLNFNELYDLYAHDVYRFAYWLCGDYLEAEDITSETFVRVWVRFDSIRTETLRAYLFAIARNIFLKKLRKRKVQAPLNETFPDRNPEPEELVDSRIELQRVQNVLATFSLALLTALAIGFFSLLLNLFLINVYYFPLWMFFVIPMLSIFFTLLVSIPCSTLLNYFAFKRGLDPNNVVNPTMTAIDDLFTVLCFYLTIIMLGVP